MGTHATLSLRDLLHLFAGLELILLLLLLHICTIKHILFLYSGNGTKNEAKPKSHCSPGMFTIHHDSFNSCSYLACYASYLFFFPQALCLSQSALFMSFMRTLTIELYLKFPLGSLSTEKWTKVSSISLAQI